MMRMAVRILRAKRDDDAAFHIYLCASFSRRGPHDWHYHRVRKPRGRKTIQQMQRRDLAEVHYYNARCQIGVYIYSHKFRVYSAQLHPAASLNQRATCEESAKVKRCCPCEILCL